jgi:hypothetical protein
MKSEKTWREAIISVLEQAGQPLHYEEIAQQITEGELRKNLGATPAITVGSQLSASIKNEGCLSPFIRVAKGTFGLRTASQTQQIISTQASESDAGEQYDIISSFGMFWQRSIIEWSTQPRILGVQQPGATPVDFNRQLGIYLLYDSRGVVYVGRSTDRPLGRRLYEHTLDRLATRWDRFSWFGLRPVLESGELGEAPVQLPGNSLIPALEAVLIEALEPRPNRKRGDDLTAVEYMQQPDAAIERKRLRTTIEHLLQKVG